MGNVERNHSFEPVSLVPFTVKYIEVLREHGFAEEEITGCLKRGIADHSTFLSWMNHEVNNAIGLVKGYSNPKLPKRLKKTIPEVIKTAHRYFTSVQRNDAIHWFQPYAFGMSKERIQEVDDFMVEMAGRPWVSLEQAQDTLNLFQQVFPDVMIHR